MKYVRKDDARKCPVHTAVLEEANNQLAEYGYFAKSDVVKDVGMIVMTDSIRWDYLAEFIKEDGKCELIPLAQRFWKMKADERVAHPEQAIAMGHGKKTMGYALVSCAGGALAIRRLEHKRSMANGVGKAFRLFADELVKRDLLEGSVRELANTVTN